MIDNLHGNNIKNQDSIKHILLVRDFQKSCLKILGESTYSIYKDFDQNLIIAEGLNPDSDAILLRIPFPNNHQYRFRVIAQKANLDGYKKAFIVNGKSCYWYDLIHGDFLQFGNATSLKYYTLPKTLDINTLKELLELSNGENWYETCLSIFNSFSSSLDTSSTEELESGLNHLALLTDSSPDLIIELSLDGKFIYINSTAIKEFPDLLDYGKLHPLLLGADKVLEQQNSVSCDTQKITVRNHLYLRTCQFNKSTNTILIWARNLKETEDKIEVKSNQTFSDDEYHQDYITNLPNRASAEYYLQEQLIKNKDQDQPIIICLINLDSFKHINEAFGYFEGDNILKIIAERLRVIVTQEQFLSHWGRDEFMIIASQMSLNEAEHFAETVIHTVEQDILMKKQEISITASLGISFSTAEHRELKILIESAYIALRQAKTNSKKSYQFYKQDTVQTPIETLKVDLKEAIEKDQLSVHYQPVINPQTGTVISVEAFLRWQHPELGFVKPSTFIPLAEQTGLIFAFGEWMLRTACLQHNHWQKIGLPKLPISVNLSYQQLKQVHFRQKLSQILDHTGIDPSYLVLETEQSVISNELGYTSDPFLRLHDLGIKFSVDNFGSAESSLSRLQDVPICCLKTDHSLIQQSTHDQSSRSVLEAIIAFSKSLRLQLVVKGVESKEQLGLLRELQCQAVQGNFVYAAMPVHQMTQVLRNCFQYSM